VLARQSIRLWSIAFALSALVHAGLVYVLAGQSWMRVRTRVPVMLAELIERTVPPARRAAFPSAPLRQALPETPPQRMVPRLPLTESPLEPPRREPSPASETVVEPQPAPSASSSPIAPRESEPATSGTAASTSPTAGSTAAVSTPGGSGAVARSVPSSGTSTEGITQWARPRGGYQIHPSYPDTARQARIEGTTRLLVHVLADGRVEEVRVGASAGHPDLDRAAADAVRQWRFEPARKGTEPVASWVILPVEFHLTR